MKTQKARQSSLFQLQLVELALKIAKSYSFKGLFICREQA